MTDFYQRIGQEILGAVGGSVERLLLYSEVEVGVISADIFYQSPNNSVVYFRFAPEALRNLIYDFWESGEAKIAPRSWAAMQFGIESGRFHVELTYPDQLNADEELSDRRPRIVAEYFPGSKVDYSNSNG